MVVDRFDRHQKTLSQLAKKNRQRALISPCGIDFSSNDYLAFSHSSRIKNAITTAIEQGVAVGAGGSRLLRGNHDVFEKLEIDAARFFNSEKSLYFGSGYAANIAIFSTLPQRGDIILYDEFVHASILDGILSSRAQAIKVRHNDFNDCVDKLKQWRKSNRGRPWLAVESIYSMDGDRAPLTELLSLADQEEGFLIIDEAHATGVFGPHGQGLAAHLQHKENVITVHTCGKALGLSGALVCLNKIFCDYLINRARTFIYSTAPSPLMAVGVNESLKLLLEEPEICYRLEKLYNLANKQILLQLNMPESGSQILPVLIGDNERAMYAAKSMQEKGFDIRAIRPPTVPEGTARLRISITLNVSEHDIINMFENLKCHV